MKPEYEAWIAANVTKAYGECADVTKRMAEAFPELHRMRGMYHCPVWGERTHWWLVAPDRSIVDPTARQFPSFGMGRYEEMPEDDDCPTGVCPDCGGHVYRDETFCSASCQRSYMAYLNTGRL